MNTHNISFNSAKVTADLSMTHKLSKIKDLSDTGHAILTQLIIRETANSLILW